MKPEKSSLIEKLNTQEIDALVYVLDHDTTIQQNYGALLISGNVKVQVRLQSIDFQDSNDWKTHGYFVRSTD